MLPPPVPAPVTLREIRPAAPKVLTAVTLPLLLNSHTGFVPSYKQHVFALASLCFHARRPPSY